MSVLTATVRERPELATRQGRGLARTVLAFPESGEYVFPAGLAAVEVDREADVGRHWEPSGWLRHALR